MQVALNILLFFTGFSIATFLALRPKKARQDVETLTNNLRYVADGLNYKARNAGIEPHVVKDGRAVQEDGKDLLTK
jgi:hypothetical protein